jgi:large subunit ribosomal protein L8e
MHSVGSEIPCRYAVGSKSRIVPRREITIVCNIEAKVGDRGAFARGSGTFAVVVTNDEDKGTTRLCLPQWWKDD